MYDIIISSYIFFPLPVSIVVGAALLDPGIQITMHWGSPPCMLIWHTKERVKVKNWRLLNTIMCNIVHCTHVIDHLQAFVWQCVGATHDKRRKSFRISHYSDKTRIAIQLFGKYSLFILFFFLAIKCMANLSDSHHPQEYEHMCHFIRLFYCIVPPSNEARLSPSSFHSSPASIALSSPSSRHNVAPKSRTSEEWNWYLNFGTRHRLAAVSWAHIPCQIHSFMYGHWSIVTSDTFEQAML